MRHLLSALTGRDCFLRIDPADVCDAPALSEAILICGGERFESPELSGPFPFHEALPSWNVDLPEGAGFCMELRVGSGDGWSPWMKAGEFGAVPAGASTPMAYGHGGVETDIFRSASLHDRFQVRLRAFGRGPGVVLRRLSVCLSHRADNPGHSERSGSLSDVPWIPVPFRSQKTEEVELRDRICSPASVAMVLEHLGVNRATSEVARRLFDPLSKTYGNWSRAVQGAFSFGIPGLLARFSTWSEVSAVLSRGQPLIISIGVRPGELTGAPYAETSGHLLVVTGLDRKRGLLVNDPAAPDEEHGRLFHSLNELEQVWLRRGGTAYVLLPASGRSRQANC